MTQRSKNLLDPVPARPLPGYPLPQAPAFIPPNYVGQAWPDTFSTRPFAPDYQARRAAFFEQVRRNPAPPRGSKRAYAEVARLAAGDAPDEKVIHTSLNEYIEGRKDCADFVMHAILRLLYQFPADFSPELIDHARRAVLGFKYWPDEPGQDSLCTWTENHQILFASAAYLAGQLYPGEVFTNTGETGRQKMAVALPRIRRWMDLRFKTGFSEWLSNVYYDEDLAPLLNLVDFAGDEELRRRASMVVDLLLFDMAINSFQGVFGSSHGRSYEQNKKWAALEGTTDVAKLLFGMGAFSAYDNMAAPLFALSENYRLPRVIYEVARDPAAPAGVENRQRMGIKIGEAERWGLGFDNQEDGMVFLSLEAYFHPRTANLTLDLFDAFGWWDNEFFKDVRAYRGLLNVLRRLRLLPLLARIAQKDIGRNTREEVNILTYRTPHYMLSSAMDYRPGYGGDQQHIWQATLSPDAVCFTTHPGRWEGLSPNYWTGSGSLPRVAQSKNVAIAIYNISSAPGLYVTNRLFFTHAWLPRDRFDEVVEAPESGDGWIFARKGDGYLALRSQQPYRWQDEEGEDRGREVIAEGKTNIWICELGSSAEHGSFEAFVDAIGAAPLHFDRLQVTYQSPSQGELAFGWRGPFRQNDQVVDLRDFARYDNAYAQVPFPAERVEITQRGHWLRLDWGAGKREMSEAI
jgi:hypothetical protein